MQIISVPHTGLIGIFTFGRIVHIEEPGKVTWRELFIMFIF
jgi:hypothetical protein